jgi:hypothetical protein
MTDEQIKHMVERFLRWRLPEDFRPDCGIEFDADAAKRLNPRNHRYEPVGTNLLSYAQAEAMVRHMLEGLPAIPLEPTEARGCGAIECVNECGGDFTWATCPNVRGAPGSETR